MSRLVLILSVIMLSGCFGKDEILPITASERIEIQDSSLGPMQLFYSLKERRVIAKNSIYAWDLAFDCRNGKFSVRINGAKGMSICKTGSFDFNTDFSAFKGQFFTDGGNHPDETAIGSWGDFSFSNPQGFGQVYLIDRGLFEQGRPIGFKKMIIKGFKDSAYHIQFANPDGTEFYYKTISTKNGGRYVYFTFEEGGNMVDVEPGPDDWDLLITPFTDTLTHFKYLFTLGYDNSKAVYDGVLLNSFSREIGIDSFRTFEDVNFRHLEEYRYSSNMQVIGKKFWYWDDVYDDYAVKSVPTFILRDNKELYYKFRFSGFRRSPQGHLSLIIDLKNL